MLSSYLFTPLISDSYHKTYIQKNKTRNKNKFNKKKDRTGGPHPYQNFHPLLSLLFLLFLLLYFFHHLLDLFWGLIPPNFFILLSVHYIYFFLHSCPHQFPTHLLKSLLLPLLDDLALFHSLITVSVSSLEICPMNSQRALVSRIVFSFITQNFVRSSDNRIVTLLFPTALRAVLILF